MNMEQENDKNHNNDCDDCGDNNTATQKSIAVDQEKCCEALTQLAGEVGQTEENYRGRKELYESKKCLFIWTEENWQIFRNTEICVGSDLLQSNDSLTENIGNYIKWNKELATCLKDITKLVKDAKGKFAELRDQACKLENCKNDSCNSTQWAVLTGKTPEECDDESKPIDQERPEACKDVEKIWHDLVCIPKGLSFDIDLIFKSASEIVGIQIFSNIASLEPLQKTLSDDFGEFEKLLVETMKLREGELKKLQEELIKCAKDVSKSNHGRYGKRSDFEGLKTTVEFICCPDCKCVEECECDDPRLKKCACDICDICEKVEKTFCKKKKKKTEQAAD